jgi:hypothetical protein
MKVYLFLQILSCFLAAVILSSCGGSTGWRVEFGVSPIKSLHNSAGISQEGSRDAIKKVY